MKGLTEAILVDISSDKKALIQKRYAKDLRQSDFTTLEKTQKVFKNVATGMNHLHRMGLVHGDLKEDNVMINSMDDVGVSDFGLTYDPRVRLFPRTTATYEAPEMLSETHLKKSFQVDLVQRRDVYSFGIMLLNQIKKFEKLTPYLHCKANFINYNYVRELYKKCYEGQSKLLFQKLSTYARKMYLPTSLDDCYYQIAADCLNPNPKLRPSSEDLLQRMKSW